MKGKDMIFIATDQPTAKADDTGDTITLAIPSGNGESVVFDLSPNQCFVLQQQLNRAGADAMRKLQAREDWQAQNVIPFRRRAQA